MNSIKLALLAMVGTVLTTSLHAQTYLLTVDISNPTNVVITATGNNATVDDSTTTLFQGVNLLGFFTSAFGSVNSVNGSPSGTLIGGGTGVGYNFFDVDNVSGSLVDLNPFFFNSEVANQTQVFSTEQPAFTGSITLDMSAYVAELPEDGATGDIRPGARSGAAGLPFGSVIGQWQVISTTPTPEPSMLALASLGGLSALALAWRRRK
jgi:hypothetical protein